MEACGWRSRSTLWRCKAKLIEAGFVYETRRGRLPSRSSAVCWLLDIKQIVRHTLRHTAITHLVQANVDLPTVKRISGHKTLAMVERYSHQNGEYIQSAMTKLSERYNATT